MRRKAMFVTAIAVFFCLIPGLLTANGGQEAGISTSNPDVIRVWTVSGHAKDIQVVQVERFNQTRGAELGIEIEYTNYGDDYTNIVKLALASGQGPEIFKRISNDVPAMANKGWILPIESFPGGDALLDRYNGYLVPLQNVINEKTYTLPYSTRSFKLVYNKDLFKEAGIVDAQGEAVPPETWDDVVEAAKRITAVGGGKEFGYVLPLKWGSYPFYGLLATSPSSFGDLGYNYESGRFDFTKLTPIFDALTQMREDGSWFPGSEGLDYDSARAHFSEGNIGMIMSVSWDVGVYNDQFPAKCDWGVAPIPVVDPDNRFKSYLRPSDMFVLGAAAAEFPEKSLAVYDFLHSDEVLAELYSAGKEIPYKASIVEMAETEPTAKGFAEFARTEEGYLYPPGPRSYADKVIEGDSYKLVFQKILLGAVEPEPALKDLTERRNAALDKVIASGRIDPEDYMIENWYEKNRLE